MSASDWKDISPPFSPRWVDRLIYEVDLENLIREYVVLERNGPRMSVGKCPFHNEKTPSFTVVLKSSRGQTFYHCFGCGAHGNALIFLQEVEHVNNMEAIIFLAKRVNMQVPWQQLKRFKKEIKKWE